MGMEKQERVALRREVLNELYEHHFSSAGNELRIYSQMKETAEKRLAYVYLMESGLIAAKVTTTKSGMYPTDAYAKITPKGIDWIEAE